jgi:hypothetical protein
LLYPKNPKCNIDKLQHVGLLRRTTQGDARVCLRQEHVDKHVGVVVLCDGQQCRLEKPAVDGAQDLDIVFALSGGVDDVVITIDHLHELAGDEQHEQDPLHLLLSAQQLTLDVLLLETPLYNSKIQKHLH